MLEVIPLPWNWPVEVNQLEAKAFCNWRAAQTGLPIRLPTSGFAARSAACASSSPFPLPRSAMSWWPRVAEWYGFQVKRDRLDKPACATQYWGGVA